MNEDYFEKACLRDLKIEESERQYKINEERARVQRLIRYEDFADGTGSVEE